MNTTNITNTIDNFSIMGFMEKITLSNIIEYIGYISIIFIILSFLYIKWYFYIEKKQSYVKINLKPVKSTLKEKGQFKKIKSFILNFYNLGSPIENNRIILEIEGLKNVKTFNVYVPKVYGADYLKFLKSHFDDFEYKIEDVKINKIDKNYNFYYFRHTKSVPLGKEQDSITVLNNIEAILNYIDEGEKLQFILNQDTGVMDEYDKKRLTNEIDLLKVDDKLLDNSLDIYKKFLVGIRFLTNKKEGVNSLGGIIGYMYDKGGNIFASNYKKGNKIYYKNHSFKDKLNSFIYRLGLGSSQYIHLFSKSNGIYLTENEIVGLYGFTYDSNIDAVLYKKYNPNELLFQMKEQNKNFSCTKIGIIDYSGMEDMYFEMNPLIKNRHIYIIGKTGTGKSTTIKILAKSDAEEGRGFMLLDPNGDLAMDVLKLIPKHRKDDVVYISPSDPLGKVSLGIFDFLHFIKEYNVEAKQKRIDENQMGLMDLNIDMIASNLVEVVKTSSIGGSDMWGPRMDIYMRLGIKALLNIKGTSISDMIPFYNDLDFMKAVVKEIKNPYEKSMWKKVFEMDQKEIDVWFQPIRNRFNNFGSDVFLSIFSVKPKFDLKKYIDSDKILIFNLAKGSVGSDVGKFLGNIVTSLTWEFIQMREKQPEHERKQFSLYIDEFQNYVNESFPKVLSEARKYRFSLILAHQYLAQIEDGGVLPAVIGNVGNMVTFQIGIDDAKVLGPHMGIDSNSMTSIPQFHAYVKSPYAVSPFNIYTFPALRDENLEYDDDVLDIIKHSYLKYGTTQEDIDHIEGIYGYFLKNNKKLPNQSIESKSSKLDKKNENQIKLIEDINEKDLKDSLLEEMSEQEKILLNSGGLYDINQINKIEEELNKNNNTNTKENIDNKEEEKEEKKEGYNNELENNKEIFSNEDFIAIENGLDINDDNKKELIVENVFELENDDIILSDDLINNDPSDYLEIDNIVDQKDLNNQSNMNFGIKDFSLDFINKDLVRIIEDKKMLSYVIKDSDGGKQWNYISELMGFTNYDLFKENCQTYISALNRSTNKVGKVHIGKDILVYYGNIVE